MHCLYCGGPTLHGACCEACLKERERTNLQKLADLNQKQFDSSKLLVKLTQPASLWRRYLAFSLDMFLLRFLMVLINTISGVKKQNDTVLTITLEGALESLFLYAVCPISLFFICETLFRATPGKLLCVLEVRNEIGGRAPWRSLLLRNVLKCGIWFIPYLVFVLLATFQYTVDMVALVKPFFILLFIMSLLMMGPMLVREDRRGTHDLVTGTQVFESGPMHPLLLWILSAIVIILHFSF